MKRGKKREHAIFGIVFLVLVIGFASFSQSESTSGQVAKDNPFYKVYKDTSEGSRITTTKSTDDFSIRSGNYDVKYSNNFIGVSSLGGLEETVLSSSFAILGSRRSDMDQFLTLSEDSDYDGNGIYDLNDVEIIKRCVLQGLNFYTRGSMSATEAEYAFTILGESIRRMCRGYGESFDVNEDGVITRGDIVSFEDVVNSAWKRENTEESFAQHLQCPARKLGEETYIAGIGPVICTYDVALELGWPVIKPVWKSLKE
jgi:hypothetical protein